MSTEADTQQFGEILQTLFDERGWGIAEFQVAMRREGFEISRQAVESWLANKTCPNFRLLSGIHRIFGIDRFFPADLARTAAVL